MSRLNNLYLFLNDEKGRTLPRAKLFFYENNSFDFKNTYADKALTSVNPNPVIADGAGRFPNIFLEADTYRVVLQDEDGVEISTKDDVDNLLSDGDNISNTTVTTSTGSQTVAGALDDRVVRVGSVAGLPAVTVGVSASVDGYYTTFKRGGGDFVGVASARHNGVINFDPDRASEIGTAAYYVDSGVDVPCWSRVRKGNDSVSLLDSGLKADGSSDDSAVWKAWISVLDSEKVRGDGFYAGVSLVTETIEVPEGVQFLGGNMQQLPRSFGIEAPISRVQFSPGSAIPFIQLAGTEHTGFRLHYAIGGFNIKSDSSASIGLYVDGAIYGKFFNLSIDGFDTAIQCNRTINNLFENIYMRARTECVSYEGNIETTDVWRHCSFQQTPTGIELNGTTLSLRFKACLFEQLNNGVILSRETQSAMFTDCYAEDVSFDGVATNAMFKLGTTGTTLVTQNNLIITGGKYAGRNAGKAGSFLETDFCNGVLLANVNIARWDTGIKTSANTRDDSIVLSGMNGISVDVWIDDLLKVNGVYPHESIGSGGQESRIGSPVALFNEIRQRDPVIGIQVAKTGEKMAFFGGTPVLQPSSTGETTGVTAPGGGVNIDTQTTFTGNVGSTQYRVNDIVKHLKNLGLIAE